MITMDSGAEKHELLWHLRGFVVETIFNTGRKDKPYWQIIIEIDGGFVCAYVRSESLRLVTEKLTVGQKIEVAGTARPHTEMTNAKRPLFLDATQLAAPQE